MSMPGMRLSPLRVAVAVIALGGLGVGTAYGYDMWSDTQSTRSEKPWFAGYVDATATPTFEFESPADDSGREVILSFIVAATDDSCTPSWGTAYSLDEASVALDLDRRIARLKQKDGGVAVSFGGLNNSELSSVCTDPADLKAAYSAVLDRYDVTTVDLDIEGDDLADTRAGERRAQVMAELQAENRAAGNDIAVWLTLPTATFGLTEDGTTAVAQMLAAGVDISGVNAMTMDFGDSREKTQSMSDASISALEQTHRQLKALYSRAGISLTDATIWHKVGATPMIGQNDIQGEIFTLDDAVALNTFAVTQGLGRMSMWSMNRDQSCGPNYVDLTRVSDSCSGVDQGAVRFATLLSPGFDGRAVRAAGNVTTSEPVDPEKILDVPATSPYVIWSESSSYLQGTKIVWHRNVYEAKWWTRGDLPDSPVLAQWETPWTLIGPVLRGETPVVVPTLPEGTYSNWEGGVAYEKGTRVLFSGVPFQAKWWTQGDSPEAASSEPDASPWVPLKASEVASIAAGLAG